MDRKYAKTSVNEEIVDIVNQYIDTVKENYNVATVILFGSYTKGTQNKDSDIDIAIVKVSLSS